MRLKWMLLALWVLSAQVATAARPVTHEDVWLMPRLGPTVLSDDGEHAVSLLVEPAYDAKEERVDLWWVDPAGKHHSRRLTQHPGAEAQPDLNADGSLLAFVAQREDDTAPQIYVLDLREGGEARRVTNLATGARRPKFSPDGTRLLIESDLYPGTRSDDDNRRVAGEIQQRKYSVRVYDGLPIRNWNHWVDERQTRLLLVNLSDGAVQDLLAGSALVAQPGYAGRSEAGTQGLDARWSPDGRQVVFIASTNAHRAALEFVNFDLYLLNLDDRELRRLNPASTDLAESYEQPRFSRDGSSVLAMVTPRSGRVYSATHLDQFDLQLGQRSSRLSAPRQLSIDSYALDPDGRTVWFLVDQAAHVNLYRARLGDSVGKRAYGLVRGIYSDLNVAGSRSQARILASYQSAIEPAELVRIDPDGKTHYPLTQFSKARLAELDLPAAEEFWFDNENGDAIHSLLIRPPGFDPGRRYPLLVAMHGGPHSMWKDHFFTRWNYHLLSSPGYVLLLTNYRGSTGYGEAFARSIHGDPFAGPASDINQAADEAIKRFDFIDGERQCALGASYGGHLANWMQGTTTRYRCLISHAGLVNLESQWGTSDILYPRELGAGGPVWEQGKVWTEQNPVRLAANFRTPTLLSVGELDYRVPLNNTLEYWALLQRRQVPSRLLVYPTEDHWIRNAENSRHYYGQVHGWLRRWLGGEG